ncbi:MAG: uroporphyrinogen-III C-methyltransferase [Cytophagaceae bacterium]
MKEPKITLVGAGPGDPDLITIKGLKALAEADVVLYDALIHDEILNFAPVTAVKVFVGKKKGVCQFPQEDINRLLVEYAQSHGHVVRLKGGDPFIFGRGHEEIVYAQSKGVKTFVVPGISSSISVPELQGIPLTRRGVNDSFWVLTGTTKDHELSADIKMAAKSNATVVMLMGMTHLSRTVELFKQEGKAELPIAIIQNGTMPDEKYVLGTISTIESLVEQNNISSPAVIVIGEVVRLHQQFDHQLLGEGNSTIRESIEALYKKISK